MRICINGTIWGSSGYANHTKNLALALNKFCEVSLDVPLFNGWERQASDEIIEMVKRFDGLEDYTIVINHPQFAKQLVNERKCVIPFVVFEGDKIPKWWAEILKYFKQCFVPSTHTQQAILNTKLIDCKVDIVPHGFSEKVFKPGEPMKDLKDDRFTFLYVGGWAQGENDRKNLVVLLRAFSEEFRKKEKVKLIVKINSAYNLPGFNLMAEVDKLNLTDDRPPIVFITDDFAEIALAKLYNTADCFVCATRAEAFGLPFLESIACGVPVIAGGYGGQTDFIQNGVNGILLKDFELVQSKDKDWIYEGINWAEYKIEDLKVAMRNQFENKDINAEMKSKCVESVKDWKWSDTAKKVLEALNGSDRRT